MKSTFRTFIIMSLLVFTYLGCSALQKISKSKPDSTTFSAKPPIKNKPKNDVNESKRDNSSSMPWISALMIGALTVLTNIYVSYNARKTSLEINRRDFNKTVLSGSRQVWITEFRSLMSEIIAKLSYFTSKNNLSEEEYNAFDLLLTKAELMLLNGTDTKLIDTISKIQTNCSEVLRSNETTFEWPLLLNEIKSGAMLAIKNEWDLVKKGE